jgi:hypothetical protein
MNKLYLYLYLLMGGLAWAAAHALPAPPVLPQREFTKNVYSDCRFKSDGAQCEEERAGAKAVSRSRQAQLRDLLEQDDFSGRQ